MLKEGDKIPNFQLRDHAGVVRSFSELINDKKYLILYFYPRDDTPGCTKEACGFRDAIGELRKLGAEVVGVSVDPPEMHSKFIAKYSLPFTLLSDIEGELAKKLGAYSEQRKRCLRKTYIINKEGKIVKIFNKVKPEEHAKEIIEFLKRL